MQEDTKKEMIEIYGAKAHNLQDISLSIPRNSLVTITGLSGCGKSSLAFDTIYAEGQRRYLETFSAYIRNYLGSMQRPEVDKITGLSPVIAIEQKSTNKNPRSTVGTVTEIYDLMRLLYARVADAYSIATGEKMIRYSEDLILNSILANFEGIEVSILLPVVRGRKGHYAELFTSIAKKGYTKVRIDTLTYTLIPGMKLNRYSIHDIEIVVDTLVVNEKNRERLKRDLKTVFGGGNSNLMVLRNDNQKVRFYSKNLMCPTSGMAYPDPEPNTFSFNSPYGACEKCNGLGEVVDIDINKLIPDWSKPLNKGGIIALSPNEDSWVYQTVCQVCRAYGGSISKPLSEMDKKLLDIILYGEEGVENRHNVTDYHTYIPGSYRGLVPIIRDQIGDNAPASIQKWASSFLNTKTCPQCQGKRLKKESLAFRIGGKDISQLSDMDLRDLSVWFENLLERLTERQLTIGKEIIREILTKIGFLVDVGLGYLKLSQRTASLSGGEAQRIRLATQIGSELVNVLYILDEPSIGLHQQDNIRLINSLKKLRDKGNSVIVVEHDKDMMMSSDWIVDIGPGAGIKGGCVVAQGTPQDILNQNSITADYLCGRRSIPIPKQRRVGNGLTLNLYGARGNNLKNTDVSIPLGLFVCVTGVSGSGKSSLINDTLHPILSKHFYRSEKKILPYDRIEGIENIDKVIEIDQSPIGRTPRSNPATYIGVFDDIRALFAELPTAKIRGYKPGRFSFNVKGGRCEECMGAGVKTLEMNFLPDVYVVCDQCNGKRYNRETLEVRYKGKSINDILDMSFDQALEFFENYPKIVQKLSIVTRVGLGYLTLGQSSTTLSGGEAQRIKLATELSRKDTGKTLYILDEPTTGLHFEDIRILLDVLGELVDKGNTMLVIEHNLDVIKMADYIIDMGLKSGSEGGRVTFCGSPEQCVENPDNSIGHFLKDILNN